VTMSSLCSVVAKAGIAGVTATNKLQQRRGKIKLMRHAGDADRYVQG